MRAGALRSLGLLLTLLALLLPMQPAAALVGGRPTITAEVYVDGRATTYPTARPGEQVVLSGRLAVGPARPVALQRWASGAWREVARQVAVDRWRLSVVAPAPGTYSYRVVALADGRTPAATSPVRTVTIVAPSVTAAAGVLERSGLRSFTGAVSPARPGQRVRLWQLRGSRWQVLAQTTQATGGVFTMRVPAGPAGSRAYRVATTGGDGQFSVRSAPEVVAAVRLPPDTGGSTYLADVTPFAEQLVGSAGVAPYVVSTADVRGTLRPKSVHTSAGILGYDVEGAASVGTVLGLLPVQREVMHRGPRMLEVGVDGRVRLRRVLADGDLVPLVVDVRGAHLLTFRTVPQPDATAMPPSDLVLVTPLASTRVRTERGVDPAP